MNDLIKISIEKIDEGNISEIQLSLENIIRAYCQLKTTPIEQICNSIHRLCLIYRSKRLFDEEADLCLWATQQNGIGLDYQAKFQLRMDDARIMNEYYSNHYDKVAVIATPMMANRSHFLSLDNNDPMKVNFIRSFLAFKNHYIDSRND